MQIYWTKVTDIIDEIPEVKTYLLDCPEDFTWDEGAHTHFALEDFNSGEKPNRGLIRHMSISTLPNEKTIGITTRIKEECSEFKATLRNIKVGDKVALFKTHSNVPLKREGKKINLLSSGIGLATFRPLVLDYLNSPENVPHVHSLTIDSSRNYLFPDIFKTVAGRNFTTATVSNRVDYYKEVERLAEDKDALFYVVGSDEFLLQNIKVLREQGISPDQIKLDKHARRLGDFLPVSEAV